MEIIFLGTGGGRFNLIKQLRRTGGIMVKGSLQLHIDPGPGALFSCLTFGLDASKTDAIVVTHDHIDHVNDAGLLTEALADGWKVKKKGWLIGSKSVLVRGKENDKPICNYHLNKMEKLVLAEHGKEIAIKIRGRKASLLPTRVKHDDMAGFGFVLTMDGFRIGYTSDTEYTGGIARQYAGCDILILNCLKPRKDRIAGHLTSKGAERIISESKPKLAILTHMGISMLRAGPKKEAKKIAQATLIRTIAAEDGMRVDAGTLRVSAPSVIRKG